MSRIIVIAILALVYWNMVTVKNKATSGHAHHGLTAEENLFVWVASMVSPVFAGAIFYYGWKKVLPLKAKQANTISLWAFLIELVIGFVVFIIVKPEVFW